MDKITVNITSCGRWSDLRRLLASLQQPYWTIQIALTQRVPIPSEFAPWIIPGFYSAAPAARNALWYRTETPIGLFLDEDCEIIAADYFQKIKNQFVIDDSSRMAVGGTYQSSKAQNVLQKSYNFVTQIWTLQNTPTNTLFLGGHFALYKKDQGREKIFDDSAPFGGEELNLFQNLRQQNFSILWSPELNVIHHPTKSWNHFFQRARLHAHAHAHPTRISKNYLNLLLKSCRRTAPHICFLGFFYLFLVYFFRLFFKASFTKTSTRASYAKPDFLAERAKSSVGSRLGFALASRKNK